MIFEDVGDIAASQSHDWVPVATDVFVSVCIKVSGRDRDAEPAVHNLSSRS